MGSLAEAPHLANLRYLDLGDNTLGVRGARALAAAEQFSHLAMLNLESTELGAEGA